MTDDSRPLRLGLALSGGGSRAIAFHLGCLRALNEIGILSRIDVISSVSGGSVLAGIYCARGVL
ncbi:MAG: patatin-like phospholipase family protein [Terricaulis sp.]